MQPPPPTTASPPPPPPTTASPPSPSPTTASPPPLPPPPTTEFPRCSSEVCFGCSAAAKTRTSTSSSRNSSPNSLSRCTSTPAPPSTHHTGLQKLSLVSLGLWGRCRPRSTASARSRYDRGARGYRADKFRKGACDNFEVMTHDRKACVERPHQKGARLTGKNIAADEKIETIELDYAGEHDRWNDYDASSYAYIIQRYEERDEVRNKYLKEQRLKKLEKNDNQQNEDGVSNDDLRVDEAMVDESKQLDFAKVEKRVRTTGGGSTGTVRNLHIREDTAKCLLNLDVNSARYDPKTRSIRGDRVPDMDPNEKFYNGDNMDRVSGQALEFKKLNTHVWEAFEKGHDVHLQAAPSQAELLYRSFEINKEKLKSQTKATIIERYGILGDIVIVLESKTI